ncbi:MAG: SemiSWEET family transporter [Nanoarchaeota archaeon]|nr:SemiSWEET family transporter [Nanoarchaeota archaeon]
MYFVDFLGYTAGLLIIVSMVPQVIKTFKIKSTKDISLMRTVLYALGVSLWTIYGFILWNGPLIAMNSLGLILGLTLLIQKLRYR